MKEFIKENIQKKAQEIWNNIPETAKVVVVFCGSLFYAVYLLHMAWTAFEIRVTKAYDKRWYELATPHMNQREIQISTMRSDITHIKEDTTETRQDVKEMRAFLMGSK